MKRWLPLAVIIVGCALLSIGVPLSSQTHDGAFTRENLLTAKADQLKATVITPHLETPLEEGQTALWCGTFQLVWNEVCTLVGEDIHFEQDPPMVAVMNRKAFTSAQIDDASYVALAGFVGDGILAKIPKALQDKFHGQASPHYLPDASLTPRPQDIVGYAYLFKHLEFQTPFERLEEPLRFLDTPVSAFGIGPYKPGHTAMYPQVSILSYEGPDDFVIELRSKSKGDQLILAKVRPEKTLGGTVAGALRRVAGATPTEARLGDVLAVPRFNFDLTRNYDEILGQGLVVTNPKVAKDLLVMAALQNIRFQMDEKGVRLRSESHMSFGCGAKREPKTVHRMIFDKPFLVLLKRTDASVPYFALWVGSPELLIRTEEKK
jgi:hypothetical protein